MSRRTIAILIFVVGILMLAVVGVIFVTSQGGEEATPVAVEGTPAAIEGEGTPGAEPPVTEEAIAPPSSMVDVVVSLQTVPRGWQIRETELAIDKRDRNDVGSDVITQTIDAIGLYARTDIFQGQTLTKGMLAGDPTLIGVENYGPSSLIPQGFVAMAVPMDRLSSVAYGLDEGDYIDIMITFSYYRLDPEFQTLLENSASFFLESVDEEGNITVVTFVVDPYGRFEELATGDIAHIAPSDEDQRPIPVAMVLQNAKVIQVGPWQPVPPVQLATPTPEPLAEGEPTPPPQGAVGATITPTPSPPDVLLVALLPQQQLFLKWAVEANANIDFALRGVNDGQLYSIENVDLNYILEQFNIEIPPDYDFTVDAIVVTPTPPPEAGEAQPQAPAGGAGE